MSMPKSLGINVRRSERGLNDMAEEVIKIIFLLKLIVGPCFGSKQTNRKAFRKFGGTYLHGPTYMNC